MQQKQIRVWDPLVRLFHWSLVASFTIAYLTEEDLLSLHVYAGYTVAGLILMRVLWGFIGTRYARFSDFVYRPSTVKVFLKDAVQLRAKRYLGHNPAGGAMIVVMMLVLLLTAVTGWAVYGIEEGGGALAVLAGPLASFEDIFEEVHEFLANLMVVLIAIHIAGVVVESLIHSENLPKAMITGRKHA